MPALRFCRLRGYFFSGVLDAGEAAGVAFTSPFFSSVFFSSAFLSSFVGLAVGLATVVGLEVVTGEDATTGVEVGVGVVGLTLDVDDSHALPIAVRTARTVSKIDLLIVFPIFTDRQASFRGSRDRC